MANRFDGLVPDISDFSQNIGSIINQAIANKALKGIQDGGITRDDVPAITRLAQRDPATAKNIMSILGQNEKQDAAVRQEQDEFKRRIAKQVSGAPTVEQKKSILQSILPNVQGRAGYEGFIADLQDDIQRFDTEPNAVSREYAGANVLFDTQEAQKVGSRKTYANGVILQSTGAGRSTVIDEGGNAHAQGTPEYQETLKRGVQSDVDQAGAKAQSRADVKLGTTEEISAKTQRGKSRESREQTFIDSGMEAVDQIANIQDAIVLLDEVETGGFESAKLRAKQMFGVESADEGELANSLGVAVLQQLKPIFGSAFTAQEGERLERLSAGFGKSPAANKRILEKQLKIADRAARRALKLAESKGDEFTASEIRAALEQLEQVKETTKKDTTEGGQKIGRFTVEVE